MRTLFYADHTDQLAAELRRIADAVAALDTELPSVYLSVGMQVRTTTEASPEQRTAAVDAICGALDVTTSLDRMPSGSRFRRGRSGAAEVYCCDLPEPEAAPVIA